MKKTTVQKGDAFEKEAFNYIEAAIKNGELGIPEAFAKVYQKKGYFSQERGKDIIFDLSIEIWPAGALSYSVVYLIECKNHAATVNIKELEAFSYKVNSVAQHNSKAVFISRSAFGKPFIEQAKKTGVMLIEIPENLPHKIVLYRSANKNFNLDSSLEDKVQIFIYETLKQKYQIQEMPDALSKAELKKLALGVRDMIAVHHNDFFNNENIQKTISYFEKNLETKFDFNKELKTPENNKLLGAFNSDDRSISVCSSIKNTPRFTFVLAHEIGHSLLHYGLKMDQATYNNYSDSFYDAAIERHRLENPKNWIEWQANYFASTLLIPDHLIKFTLIQEQDKMGIARVGYVYLDEQITNNQAFKRILAALAKRFNVTKTSIAYKMHELGLVHYKRNIDNTKSVLQKSLQALDD